VYSDSEMYSYSLFLLVIFIYQSNPSFSTKEGCYVRNEWKAALKDYSFTSLDILVQAQDTGSTLGIVIGDEYGKQDEVKIMEDSIFINGENRTGELNIPHIGWVHLTLTFKSNLTIVGPDSRIWTTFMIQNQST
ncbi:unnamed protein product, partial [Meganyctiphanes norvegica]